MNYKTKLLKKYNLLIMFVISLNCLHTFSQENNNSIEPEKLKQKFYYVSEEKINELIKTSTELSIKFIEIDDEILITKNDKKCILTTDIIDYIVSEKKGDIVEKIQNSIAKWRSYYNLQSKIAVNLTKHLKAYKSRLMTKSRQIIWQKETKECISIQEKMNKIPFADSSNFYKQLKTEENQVHSGILYIMNSSRNILGI